jgi:hypothetical protein
MVEVHEFYDRQRALAIIAEARAAYERGDWKRAAH